MTETRRLIRAYADLWRSAPRDMRHDLLTLLGFMPAALCAFRYLWIMLPA